MMICLQLPLGDVQGCCQRSTVAANRISPCSLSDFSQSCYKVQCIWV